MLCLLLHLQAKSNGCVESSLPEWWSLAWSSLACLDSGEDRFSSRSSQLIDERTVRALSADVVVEQKVDLCDATFAVVLSRSMRINGRVGLKPAEWGIVRSYDQTVRHFSVDSTPHPAHIPHAETFSRGVAQEPERQAATQPPRGCHTWFVKGRTREKCGFPTRHTTDPCHYSVVYWIQQLLTALQQLPAPHHRPSIELLLHLRMTPPTDPTTPRAWSQHSQGSSWDTSDLWDVWVGGLFGQTTKPSAEWCANGDELQSGKGCWVRGDVTTGRIAVKQDQNTRGGRPEVDNWSVQSVDETSAIQVSDGLSWI